MKVKVSELTGSALDWAVALCDRVELDENNAPIWFGDSNAREPYTPSTNWAQGGPIIAEKGICLIRPESGAWWDARYPCFSSEYVRGPTALIAAMRCFVRYQMGREVEIPQELL